VSDDPTLALLALLRERDGASLPAVAKRLALSQSELKRLLAALGLEPGVGGLGLVDVREDDGRERIWLTEAGRRLCAGNEGRDGALATLAAWRLAAAREAFTDTVVVERPVALLYNGLAFAVMLATPTDLEDFALGFSLSEGIVADADDWRLLERTDGADGTCLEMAIPQARAEALDARRRGLAGRSGCGLCGVESLQAALPPVPRLPPRAPVPAAAVHAALAKLESLQPLNARSGGVHAAAFAHADGLLVREDVGRHNALDKVLGARARAGLDDGFLLVTSRASVELVHKAATCGVGLLVAISAPTSLAIRLADECGLALAAFARGGAMTLYSHHERIG
jgi:formate dehydrogenase accessory protein FdhD